MTFIEVVRGDMDLTHIGKVIMYLSRLMEAQPKRTHVYGVLTNLEYTILYHCTGSKIGHTQPVKYEQGLFLSPARCQHVYGMKTQISSCHARLKKVVR